MRLLQKARGAERSSPLQRGEFAALVNLSPEMDSCRRHVHLCPSPSPALVHSVVLAPCPVGRLICCKGGFEKYERLPLPLKLSGMGGKLCDLLLPEHREAKEAWQKQRDREIALLLAK